jgi:hypothetical protein
VSGYIYTEFVSSHPLIPIAISLVSGPPDVVVGFLGRVKDKLGAGVDGTIREDVLADLPGPEV